MKNKKYDYIDLELKNISSSQVELVKKLVSEDISVRKEARQKIIGEGKEFLPVIYELFKSDNSLLRWEAAQVLKESPHSESIPQLLILMDDEDMDIRWIASEALINKGRISIRPVLEKLSDMKQDSINLRLSAHHILAELMTPTEKEKYKHLLTKLNRNTEITEDLSVTVHKVLMEYGKI